MSTPDEMLDVVKEKENISAEVDMIECGRIVDNDTTIVVGMTGENDKTYHYYAAQFSKNQDGKYKYKNAISLNDIGWQLRLGKCSCSKFLSQILKIVVKNFSEIVPGKQTQKEGFRPLIF